MRKESLFHFRKLAAGVFVTLAIMAASTYVLAADVFVVVNKNVPEDSLSKADLKAIFLGQKTTWKNGAAIEFVTQTDSSSVHEDFLKKYVEKSGAQFNNYWKQQVFTGKGRMPKQLDSDSKLADYISATEGAIGYVSSSAAKGTAKVLTITE